MALSDYALFIAYFAIGIAVYSKLEGWSPLDATYFMMTVSTTVGYGDLAPASADGRLFTCVYALLGTTVIISALSPAVAWALGLLRSYYDRVVPLLVDTEDYTLSLKELNQRISYPRRYLRALLGPALLMLVGVLHGIYGGGLGVLDACYFSIITMTTVGFGDLTPTSDADKALRSLPSARGHRARRRAERDREHQHAPQDPRDRPPRKPRQAAPGKGRQDAE